MDKRLERILPRVQKPARDTFFSFKDERQAPRPTSVATEFVDTDWDEELLTEAEDNSPRVSLQSVSNAPHPSEPYSFGD